MQLMCMHGNRQSNQNRIDAIVHCDAEPVPPVTQASTIKHLVWPTLLAVGAERHSAAAQQCLRLLQAEMCCHALLGLQCPVLLGAVSPQAAVLLLYCLHLKKASRPLHHPTAAAAACKSAEAAAASAVAKTHRAAAGNCRVGDTEEKQLPCWNCAGQLTDSLRQCRYGSKGC
jgi:hypothetical protein